MPTTHPAVFLKNQYGDNSEYIEKYVGFIQRNGGEGLCNAAAHYFIEQVIADNTVTFNTSEICTSIIIKAFLEKQINYLDAFNSGSTTDKKYTKSRLKNAMMANPENYHSRGLSSNILRTDNPDRAIGKILAHRDRYPCGIISIYQAEDAHAVAYACDKTYLYLYDPNYGIMRFSRTTPESLRQAFFFYASTGQNYRTHCIEQVYCRNPAKISEPGRMAWGNPNALF
ncbi:hypothetical protein SMQE13_08970 [Serratia marcescens]|nr:hypothetical protein SMQE13_08970 [Serratia marcescens]